MNSNARGRKALVTGGAGFIGSEVVRQLCADGTRVIAVDNLVNGKRENLAGLPPDLCALEVVDIRDSKAMSPLMQGVDTVFHLACLGVRHSLHSPRENHDVNATATLDLLETARRARVGRFVYVSSSEVYGTARWVPMTEEHPTYPKTVYGGSKLAGECYTRAYYDSFGYPTVVIRPFNTYGPRCHHEGDSGEVIPKFMLRCLAGKPMLVFGDGTQTRDFTYVSDTAAGIILAGTADSAVGETINLGFGSEISVNDLALAVRRVAGCPETVIAHDIARPGDVLRLYADMSRARRLLGYDPHIGLEEGLGKLLEWYSASGKTAGALLEQEIEHNWKIQSGAIHA